MVRHGKKKPRFRRGYGGTSSPEASGEPGTRSSFGEYIVEYSGRCDDFSDELPALHSLDEAFEVSGLLFGSAFPENGDFPVFGGFGVAFVETVAIVHLQSGPCVP